MAARAAPPAAQRRSPADQSRWTSPKACPGRCRSTASRLSDEEGQGERAPSRSGWFGRGGVLRSRPLVTGDSVAASHCAQPLPICSAGRITARSRRGVAAGLVTLALAARDQRLRNRAAAAALDVRRVGVRYREHGDPRGLRHTGDQKKRWLEPLLNQDMFSAFSMTEPQSGSDPDLFKTHAVQDGDEWVINGESEAGRDSNSLPPGPNSLSKRGVKLMRWRALPSYAEPSRDLLCCSGNHLRESPCKLSQAP